MAKASTTKKKSGSKSKLKTTPKKKASSSVLEKSIKALVAKGKKNKQINVDDIAEILSNETYTSQQLDEIIIRLNEAEIDIVDPQKKLVKKTETKKVAKPKSSVAPDYGRVNDPVKLYL